MLTFPTWIPGCDSKSTAVLDLFISSEASICSTISLHWEILIMFSQFPLIFHQNQLRTILVLTGMVFVII